MKLSVIVATCGRPTLVNTLNSLCQLDADDEVMLLVDGGQTDALRSLAGARLPCRVKTIVRAAAAEDSGHGIRDAYAARASGDYVLHMDDDDAYVPGAIERVRRGIERDRGKMLIFSVVAKERAVPWPGQHEIWYGNISTLCVALPNEPARWGRWGGEGPGGDCRFFSGCRFERVWLDSTIAVIRPHEWPSPADRYVSWRPEGRPPRAAPALPEPAAPPAVLVAPVAPTAPALPALPALPAAPRPGPFSFHLTHPDGTRETSAVAGHQAAEPYPRGGPLRIGLAIGTCASAAYVHLGLESCRRYCPGVEVLVHDDASAERDCLAELCRGYGAWFESNSEKRGHTRGDLTAFLGGLLWSRQRGHDILVKFSRRFVPTRDWLTELTELARQSQEATFSNICRNLNWGFRSEVVAMHPPAWATAAETIRDEVLSGREVFVEGFIHELAKRIRPSAGALEYRRACPRETWCGGYCPWPVMGESRVEKVPGAVWHHSSEPDDYLDLARRWGLPYQLEDFRV